MPRAFSQDLIHLFVVPGLGVLNKFLPWPAKCLSLVGWTEHLFLSTIYVDRRTSVHKVTACMMYSEFSYSSLRTVVFWYQISFTISRACTCSYQTMRPLKWLSGQLLGKLPEMRESIISHHPNDLQWFENITFGCEDSSKSMGWTLGGFL